MGRLEQEATNKNIKNIIITDAFFMRRLTLSSLVAKPSSETICYVPFFLISEILT